MPRRNRKQVDTVMKIRNDGDFSLYAYCIMDNYIHLYLKEGEDKISRVLKRIGTSYAFYYNKKHNRVEYVFHDRVRSEGIMSDAQLMEVIRYIHNNPVKAHMIERAEGCSWSSYRRYVSKVEKLNGQETFESDILEVLEVFSHVRDKTAKLFLDFTKERTGEKFLDADFTEDQQDEIQLEKILQELLAKKGVSFEIVRNDKTLREDRIRELKYKYKASIRRTAELLGVNRNIVQRTNI